MGRGFFKFHPLYRGKRYDNGTRGRPRSTEMEMSKTKTKRGSSQKRKQRISRWQRSLKSSGVQYLFPPGLEEQERGCERVAGLQREAEEHHKPGITVCLHARAFSTSLKGGKSHHYSKHQGLQGFVTSTGVDRV